MTANAPLHGTLRDKAVPRRVVLRWPSSRKGKERKVEAQSVDQITAQLGRLATFTWLGGGALLLLVDGGLGMMISLRALLFLGVGMFVSSFLVGLLSYKIFVKLADKAALAAGAGDAREAILRSFRQSRIAAIVLGLVFVLWVYAGFFWY
jgi:hypothetical protein